MRRTRRVLKSDTNLKTPHSQKPINPPFSISGTQESLSLRPELKLKFLKLVNAHWINEPVETATKSESFDKASNELAAKGCVSYHYIYT